MAKRKTTRKSSPKETNDTVDAPEVTDGSTTPDADAREAEPPLDASAEDSVSEETADAAELEDSFSDKPDSQDADLQEPSSDEAQKGDESIDTKALDEAAESEIDSPDEPIELSEPDGSDVNENALTEDRDTPIELDEAALEGAEFSTEPSDGHAESASEGQISTEEAEQLIENAETGQPSAEPVIPPTPAPEIIKETVVERKGGLMPTLLGGVIAASLGYGGAAYVSQNAWPFISSDASAFEAEMRDVMSAQSGALTEITDRVKALEGVEPPVFDPSPLQSNIAALQETATGVASELQAIAERSAAISARVEALEKQPIEQAVSPEAIAAYERALEELQAEVEAQRSEVSRMAQEALQAEDNAVEQAQLAAARAALAEVTTALDTGSGFAEALAVLSENGVDVPGTLTNSAENGIATQGALMDAFPEAARAALSAARTEATDGAEGSNRVATFFANQLGARSVAPREGNDPDAVLSRAEAALRDGDLSAALTELSALPEVAQSAVAQWQSAASTRLEAKSAADALVQQLLQE